MNAAYLACSPAFTRSWNVGHMTYYDVDVHAIDEKNVDGNHDHKKLEQLIMEV